MYNLIIIAVLSLLLGGTFVYFILRNKIQQRVKLDEQTAQKNTDLKVELAKLEQSYADYFKKFEEDKESKLSYLNLEYESWIKQIENLKIKKEEADTAMQIDLQSRYDENEEKIAKQYALRLEQLENQYKDAEAIAAANFERNIESLRQQLENDVKKYTDDYFYLKESCMEEFTNQINEQKNEIDKLNSQITALKQIEHTAIEAAKRAELIRTEEEFYKIQLPEDDLSEIQSLKDVASHLRNKEPLYKVIWKYYYEKPTSDLINRVVGPETKTGIYKITNLKNNMCYIGQAADIAARFKQHIKRGLGAEAATKNKLYPAMFQLGVENFSFEIIEECSREELNAKEGYWTDYFESKDFGYNVRRV